ncbi:MAG: hypothetical protein NVS9B15_04670 [Acidobacteriaceae bacterium]
MHLGQSRKEIVETFGEPESITSQYRGEYYLNYPSIGFEVDIGSRNGVAKYMFFFREGVRGHSGADVILEGGLKLGDTRFQVIKILGEPSKSGDPTTLNSGESFGEWFSYSFGVNLQFGTDNRIDMITILNSTPDVECPTLDPA